MESELIQYFLSSMMNTIELRGRHRTDIPINKPLGIEESLLSLNHEDTIMNTQAISIYTAQTNDITGI